MQLGESNPGSLELATRIDSQPFSLPALNVQTSMPSTGDSMEGTLLMRSDCDCLQKSIPTDCRNLLGNNQVFDQCAENRNSPNKREYTRFSVENPIWEKPRECNTPNDHYTQRMYNGELQGDDLELAVLATGGGITQRRRRQRPRSLSLSLSLSHGCAPSLSQSGKTEK